MKKSRCIYKTFRLENQIILRENLEHYPISVMTEPLKSSKAQATPKDWCHFTMQ